MPDLLAKGVAVTVGVLLAMVIGILVFTSRPPADATVVTAEFDNAFPLIEGMYVRVDGAIAGSVGTITVNDRAVDAHVHALDQREGVVELSRYHRRVGRRPRGEDEDPDHHREQYADGDRDTLCEQIRHQPPSSPLLASA